MGTKRLDGERMVAVCKYFRGNLTLLRRSVNFEGQEVKVVTEGKVKAALFPVGRKSGGELEEMCRDGSLLATFTAMLPRTCFFHTCKME